jgi:uncharacterized protein YdaU (DUF1376 family)
MSKLPWMPFNAADWITSPTVATMTAAQRGGYIQLLAYAWADEDCSLPDNSEMLARLAAISPDDAAVVLGQFQPHPDKPGRIVNARQRREWASSVEYHNARSEAGRIAGKRSGEARRMVERNDSGTVVQRPFNDRSTTVERNTNEIEPINRTTTNTTTPSLLAGAFTPESPLPPGTAPNGTRTAPAQTDSEGNLPDQPQAMVVDIGGNRSKSCEVGRSGEQSRVDTPETEKVQQRASVREIDQPQGDFPAGWWRRACLLADMIETADSPEPVICPNGAARAMALCYAGETMKGELDQVEAVVRAICEHPKHERLSGILAGLRKYPDAPIPGNGSRPGRNSRLEQALAIITRERIVPMVNPTHRRKSA